MTNEYNKDSFPTGTHGVLAGNWVEELALIETGFVSGKVGCINFLPRRSLALTSA